MQTLLKQTGVYLERNEVIRAIRCALQERSGKQWSVTGGRGTAWGWITIDAPPARRTWSHRLRAGAADLPENYEEYDTGKPGHSMSPQDREELAQLMGTPAHYQGISIAASQAYYAEYLARAQGRTPDAIAQPYWD